MPSPVHALTPMLLLFTVGCGPRVGGGTGEAVDDLPTGDDGAFLIEPDLGPPPKPGGGDEDTDGGGVPEPEGPFDDGDTDNEPQPSDPIYSGEHFVDAFFAASGLYLVHREGVDLVAPDGSLIEHYTSPRAIDAAAWDGEWLAIADQAELSVLDTALVPGPSTPLVERCVSAVMVSGPRLVCGPESDWDRLIYTYDALRGDLVGTSAPNTYRGLPMRRVPGTDDFVTVTLGLSPSDFHLYDAAPSSVVYLNESPYHGDFPADLVQAYVGSPATHLINRDGTMLKIYGDGCDTQLGAPCFVKDGSLGTLPAGASGFVDLREGDDGYIYAIVDVSGEAVFLPPCAERCVVQRIDAERRVVVDEEPLVLEGHEFAYLRPGPVGTGVMIIAGWNAPFEPAHDGQVAFDVYAALD